MKHPKKTVAAFVLAILAMSASFCLALPYCKHCTFKHTYLRLFCPDGCQKEEWTPGICWSYDSGPIAYTTVFWSGEQGHVENGTINVQQRILTGECDEVVNCDYSNGTETISTVVFPNYQMATCAP